MSELLIDPRAVVESSDVGSGTSISAFAHIQKGARLGRDCKICGHVLVERDVVLGDRVTIQCGVQAWSGLRLEDDVSLGPNVTFTHDHPTVDQPGSRPRHHTILRAGASVGANATILSGVHIGRHALVRAGAVVTHDVPAYGVVAGNPAQLMGFNGARPVTLAEPSRIDRAAFSQVGIISDPRGDLLIREIESSLPFIPKRFFSIFNVPEAQVRGQHAHKTLEQFFVPLSGSVEVVLDNGKVREHYTLDSPRLGLYAPPRTWCTLYNYSAGAVILVLASDVYDAEDYLHDYEEFCTMEYTGAPTAGAKA